MKIFFPELNHRVYVSNNSDTGHNKLSSKMNPLAADRRHAPTKTVGFINCVHSSSRLIGGFVRFVCRSEDCDLSSNGACIEPQQYLPRVEES